MSRLLTAGIGLSVGHHTADLLSPQSNVSEAVARLRERGTVESFPDPADCRRTLVRVSAQHPRDVMRAAWSGQTLP